MRGSRHLVAAGSGFTLDQCTQIVVGVFDPRVQCRRQQEILVFDLFRGQAVAQTEERAIGTFPKVDRAVMPRTLQRQQQGNRAGRKGRRQIRLEAQLANRQIRFDGQVSQFARKCIIVMRDAVCDDQIRTVRTEGTSFGQRACS